MKIRSRSGHVLNSEFRFYRSIYKKRNESCLVLGPFYSDHKQYVSVVYFDRSSYLKWRLRGFFALPMVFLIPGFYLRTQSGLTKLIQGMTILDDDANLVADKNLNLRISKITFTWIEVYLAPFFPPL